MLNAPPNPVGGTSAAANWLRRLQASVRGLRILPGVGYKVKYTTNGTVLEVVTGGVGGRTTSVAVKQYVFKSHAADHIVCRTWDGTTQGDTDVLIAKPFKLRYSLTGTQIDGNAISYDYSGDSTFVYQRRTASISGGASEKQVIRPFYNNYTVDTTEYADIIYAVTSDYTNVTVSETELTLIDINVDGRVWCRRADQS